MIENLVILISRENVSRILCVSNNEGDTRGIIAADIITMSEIVLFCVYRLFICRFHSPAQTTALLIQRTRWRN